MEPENPTSSLGSFSLWKYWGDRGTHPLASKRCPVLVSGAQSLVAVGTVAAALAQVSYQGLVVGSFSSRRKTWKNLVVSLSLCICVGLGEGLLIWHLDVRL